MNKEIDFYISMVTVKMKNTILKYNSSLEELNRIKDEIDIEIRKITKDIYDKTNFKNEKNKLEIYMKDIIEFSLDNITEDNFIVRHTEYELDEINPYWDIPTFNVNYYKNTSDGQDVMIHVKEDMIVIYLIDMYNDGWESFISGIFEYNVKI